MAEDERWQTELFDNAPSWMPSRLSCPISGIWLLYFTYSKSNLTSTGLNDQLECSEEGMRREIEQRKNKKEVGRDKDKKVLEKQCWC